MSESEQTTAIYNSVDDEIFGLKAACNFLFGLGRFDFNLKQNSTSEHPDFSDDVTQVLWSIWTMRGEVDSSEQVRNTLDEEYRRALELDQEHSQYESENHRGW